MEAMPVIYSLSAQRSEADGVVDHLSARRFRAHMAALCALLALFGAPVCAEAQSTNRPSPLVCAAADCPKPASVGFDPSWVQLSPATSPSAGQGAAIAYDSAHGQVVLFGGQGGPPDNSFLADT
jgi:hypothetical protein